MGDTGHVTFLHEGQSVRAAVKDCKKVVKPFPLIILTILINQTCNHEMFRCLTAASSSASRTPSPPSC